VEAIALGSDFREAVEGSLANCGVFLAVIGPTWLNAKAPDDPSGPRRLDNPGDYVRQEVASALKKGSRLPVIPVLVRGASMPTADQLPDDLKDLAYRNALTLNNLDWDGNVAKLVSAIRPHVGEPATSDTKVSDIPSSRDTRQTTGSHIAVTASPAASSTSRKGLIIGIVALVVAVVLLYLVFGNRSKTATNSAVTSGKTSNEALTVTIARNPRLTDVQGPVDVSIDNKQVGQIKFNDNGSTPLQFQVTEGPHNFELDNAQTHANCKGPFTVGPNQNKFVLRMRDGGTACEFDESH
jgi:hypothetical protein